MADLEEIRICADCGEQLDGRNEVDFGGDACHLDCAWTDATSLLSTVLTNASSKPSVDNLLDAHDCVIEILEKIKAKVEQRQREEWRQAAYAANKSAILSVLRPL